METHKLQLEEGFEDHRGKILPIVHEKDEPLFAALEGNTLLERRQGEWRLLMIGLQKRIKAC